MIDITTIQTFDIPHDIKALKSENIQLLKENKVISKQNKIFIGFIIFIVVVAGILVSLPKKDKNENQ